MLRIKELEKSLKEFNIKNESLIKEVEKNKSLMNEKEKLIKELNELKEENERKKNEEVIQKMNERFKKD